MSLVDPTIKDATSVRVGAGRLVASWSVVFVMVALGSFLASKAFLLAEADASAWLVVASSVAGFVIFGIGFASVVVGAAGYMHIKGALSASLAVVAFGMALGTWFSFGAAARVVISIFVIGGLISLLFAGLAVRAQRARRALIASLTPHQGFVHEQGYTEATWVEYSGTRGPVVFRFADQRGRERYVTRVITQYRDSPMPNGTPVQMFWDPANPGDTSKIVFSREVHRRTEYF